MPLTPIKNKVVAAIPCYNTQGSIGQVVAATQKYVDEVIVIDDGSTDMTAHIAESAGAVVVAHPENRGYGEAIKSCVKAALIHKADILIIIDGDGQHNPDEIPRLLLPLSRGEVDLVIGSRFAGSVQKMPRYRKFGIEFINYLWNFGSKERVSDTQSGFRAYSKKVIEELNFSEKGMGISIEILEDAKRKGFKIKEVPISCSYENNNASFSSKAFWHGFAVAIAVLKIRIKTKLKAR
jgi:glycosyltransferase involved in cell wall biosynthesis